jgi:hypothetical protein
MDQSRNTDHMKSESLPTDEALALSAELAGLTRKQYQALVKSSIAPLSPEESDQNDRRRTRIVEICERLNYCPTR